jgi:hypothetical protein
MVQVLPDWTFLASYHGGAWLLHSRPRYLPPKPGVDRLPGGVHGERADVGQTGVGQAGDGGFEHELPEMRACFNALKRPAWLNRRLCMADRGSVLAVFIRNASSCFSGSSRKVRRSVRLRSDVLPGPVQVDFIVVMQAIAGEVPQQSRGTRWAICGSG